MLAGNNLLAGNKMLSQALKNRNAGLQKFKEKRMSTPKKTSLLLISLSFLGLGFFATSFLPSAVSQEKKPIAKSPTDLELFRASATRFENAFNTQNPKAIAAQFLENAEVVDESGQVVQGRALIETRFAESFKNFPQAQIKIEITSVRRLSPEVAVEDGVSTITLDPTEPASRNAYSVVHVKREGQWLFASVKDFPAEPLITPHDHLQDLAWLVGHWVDESDHSRVETTCEWSDDQNYLLQHYRVKTRSGQEMQGVQRIGYDPLRRTIRAWAFDRNGTFVESNWTPIDETWVIKAEGVTSAGEAAFATRVLTRISSDAYRIDSVSQLVGKQSLPDSSVVVVRRPPTPLE